MSAPKTNVKNQRKRHWGALLGMAAVAIFGVGLILYWIFEEAAEGTAPAGADVQIDGRTGDPSPDEPLQPVQVGPSGALPADALEEQTVTPGPADGETAEPNGQN